MTLKNYNKGQVRSYEKSKLEILEGNYPLKNSLNLLLPPLQLTFPSIPTLKSTLRAFSIKK